MIFSQEVFGTKMCKQAILNDNVFHVIAGGELLFICSGKQGKTSMMWNTKEMHNSNTDAIETDELEEAPKQRQI